MESFQTQGVTNEAAYYTNGVESGTTEYNLWRIATTSAGGMYNYAPSANQLSVIFRNIADSIFSSENPSKIISVKASMPPGGIKDVVLYDDGLHNDGAAGDELYGSDYVEAPEKIETWIDYAIVQAKDWALSIGIGEAEYVLDNQPPLVSELTVYYPPNSTSVADGQIFNVSVRAVDQHAGILRITADGTELGVLSSVPFSDDGTGNDNVSGDSIFTSSNMTPATGNSEAGYRFLDTTVIDGAGNPTKVRIQIHIVNDRFAPILIMVHPGDFPFLSNKDTVRAYVKDDGKIERVNFTLTQIGGLKPIRYGTLRETGEDGIYECPVDVSRLDEKFYNFTLIATDTAGRVTDTGILKIGVDNSYPTFKLLSPKNNTGISGVATFKYSYFNETFPDGVYCRVDKGAQINLNKGLDTTLFDEGPHEVYVYARDRSGKETGEHLTLYFDNSDPVLVKHSPVNRQIIRAGDYFNISASDGGGIQSVRILLYDLGGRDTGKPASPPFSMEMPKYVQMLRGPDIPGVVWASFYTGQLPDVSVMDGIYLFGAQVTDRSGRTTSNWSYVTIDNHGPSIDIRRPFDGERVEGGIVPDVEVSDVDLVDDYILFRGLKYSRGDAIDLVGVPEGTYMLRVVAVDALGQTSFMDREFFIDSTPPRIEVSTPGDGAVLKGELSVIAHITDGSGIASTGLIVDGYEISPGVMLSEGLYSFRMDLGPFNMSRHDFRIRAKDRAGLEGFSEAREFLNERYDTDDDGVLDPFDDAPKDPRRTGDYDGDGFGSMYDQDDDGDGTLDSYEPAGDSLNADGSRKGVPFSQDPAEWMDTDLDGIGNNADSDDDSDGIPDIVDMFPVNNTEWGDADMDGLGDNADPDIDGDGVVNAKDAFPFISAEWRDTDRDGVGDNTDEDDDNDGITDSRDDFPKDRKRQYFWEPILLVLFIVLLCSGIVFTGMVFKAQISNNFDRSWDEGALFKMRSGIRRRFSRKKVWEEEEDSAKKPPQRGRPSPRKPLREPRGRPVPARKSPAEDSYSEEKVGSHSVRWSPK